MIRIDDHWKSLHNVVHRGQGLTHSEHLAFKGAPGLLGFTRCMPMDCDWPWPADPDFLTFRAIVGRQPLSLG